MNKFLDGINIKVKNIVNSLNELQEKNQNLNKDLNEIKHVVNTKNRRIEELEEKMRLISIVKSVKTEDKKSVNNELKQIIKMIDECILSLNAE